MESNNHHNPYVRLIGHAHLDLAWIWGWQDACQEALSTFSSAVSRLHENPDLHFIQGEAIFYEWIEEFDPGLFKEIGKLIAEKRWFVVNGWWTQADCNLACGEGLIRQALYGKKYFYEKFGIDVKTAFSPDSFGHPSSLVQILKLCGYDNFIFKRPSRLQLELPGQLFLWENASNDQGGSGSRILSFRITDQYSIEECEPLDEHIEAAKNGLLEFMKETVCFFGVGNHGGGPTISQINKIRELQKEKKFNIGFDSLEGYFTEAEKHMEKIKVVKNELQYDAVGCYSVVNDLKKLNRKAEELLLSAEKWDAISSMLFRHAASNDEIELLWKKQMFNNFHDVLTGSCVPEVHQDAVNLYGSVIAGAEEIEHAALRNISRFYSGSSYSLNATYNGLLYNFFNSTSYEREELVEIEPWFGWYENMEGNYFIEDCRGNEIPYQEIPAASPKKEMRRILFKVTVPSHGFSTYKISKKDDPQEPFETALKITENTMENQFLKAEFNVSDGMLVKLIDKSTEKNLICADQGSCGKIFKDESNAWGHDVIGFDNYIGQFENADLKMLEKGPLRIKLRIKSYWKNSWLIQDYSLDHFSKKLRCDAQVCWQENHKGLKICFPFDIRNPEVTAETPYGWTFYENKGHEFPGQKWLSLFKENKRINLVNDSKYGFSVKGSEIGMTVLRSPIYGNESRDGILPKDREHIFTDQGIFSFSYSLSFENNPYKDGLIFNSPLKALPDSLYKASIPLPVSFVSSDNENISLEVIKRHDSKQETVIRLFSSASTGEESVIRSSFLRIEEKVRLCPGEIKTFIVQDGKLKEILPIESPR